MPPDVMSDLQLSLTYLSAQTVSQLSLYVPRVLAALVILVVGSLFSKFVKRIVVKLLEAITLSKVLKNTPVEHFIVHAELNQKVEEVVGTVIYWLIMLVFINASVAVLGLVGVTTVLERMLAYIPSVFSAVVVLFFGLLLAGVVESLVKASIKTVDGKAARFLGKVSSYLVITITVLAAISELGIAREFIMILFMGFVGTISVGFGLALGLGGQEVVRKMLGEWYERVREEVRE